MKKTVIFGAGKVAEVVHHCMAHESPREVAGFTCDDEHVGSDSFLGLPVVPFSAVQETFPPGDFDMFVALGYQDLNRLRARRLEAARNKGYSLPSFIHPRSGMPADTIYGDNCFVMSPVCIQPKVKLGHNVFVWSGALVGHHSTVGDNCWITSQANICGVVTVGNNCFLAANATIGNDVTIGNNCFLGANALVTKDLPDGRVVVQKSSDVLRLSSDEFLRMSKFH